MSRILHELRLSFARAFYQWALREIDPLHPDLPCLLMRARALEDMR